MAPELRGGASVVVVVGGSIDAFTFGMVADCILEGGGGGGWKAVARIGGDRLTSLVGECVAPEPALRPAIGSVFARLAHEKGCLLPDVDRAVYSDYVRRVEQFEKTPEPDPNAMAPLRGVFKAPQTPVGPAPPRIDAAGADAPEIAHRGRTSQKSRPAVDITSDCGVKYMRANGLSIPYSCLTPAFNVLFDRLLDSGAGSSRQRIRWVCIIRIPRRRFQMSRNG
jgi:hypothetical protein